VVARNGKDGNTEATQEIRCTGVLVASASVRQVSARDHELGREPLDQVGETRLDAPFNGTPGVEVRKVEDSCP